MDYVRRIIGVILVLFIFKTLIAQNIHPELHKNISFIENKNQWESNILFKLEYQNSTLFFEKDGITNAVIDPNAYTEILNHKFSFDKNKEISDTRISFFGYKIKFLNSSPLVNVSGQEKHDFYHNYFIGNDPAKWASYVSVYQTISYNELYKNINLKYYEDKGLLKYEFIVNPGGDPNQIALEYIGDLKLKIMDGILVIKTSIGELKELKPYAYQIDNKGNKIPIACYYNLIKNRINFKLSNYNTELPLIIDPTLIFSTYSGSTSDNWGFTATYDLNGNMYGGGIGFSTGYPTTLGAYQTSFGGSIDIVISKFNSTGNALIFATYLGGNVAEMPHSLIVNENNELYIFGTTGSSNYPITTGAFQNTFHGGPSLTTSSSLSFPNGTDIIISKLNQSGSTLLGSTFMGGSANDGINIATALRKNYADDARGEIILDEYSNVYVTSSTYSSNFPTTPGSFQTNYTGNQSAVIFKMNHNLTNLIWSSYLNGTGNSMTAGYSLSLGENNSVYITGGTTSTDLPATPNAYHSTYQGGVADGYIAHFSPDGSSLFALTYFGSSVYDQSYLIKADKYFHPHIVGQTFAPQNSLLFNAAWHSGKGQFITKFAPDLQSLVWSTEFGTSNSGPDISPTALLVDVCNRIYLSGWGGTLINGFGGTTGLPTTSDAFQNTTDDNDYYLLCIADDASSLLYGSFFGNQSSHSREHVDGGTSRFDKQGRIYQAVCAGCGGYDDFPTTPGAYSQTNNSSNCNLAVFKIDFNLPAVVAEFNMPNTVCAPANVSFNNQSLVIGSNTSFHWDFGDGGTSTDFMPSHTYSQAGLYNITLIVHDLSSCNFADTLTKTITVLANTSYSIPSINICSGETVQIGILPAPQDEVTYHWTPTTGLNNPNISNPMANITATITYTLLVSNGICSDTITQIVSIVDIDITMDASYIVCEGEEAHIIPIVTANVPVQYIWSTSPTFNNIINSDLNSPNLDYTPTQNSTTLYFKVVYEDCEMFQNTQIIISPLQVTAPETLVVCFNNPEQITLQVNPSNCTYEWAPQEYIISGGNSSSPTVNPPINTTFYVTVTNSNGCKKMISIPVTTQMGTFEGIFNAWCVNPNIFLGDSTLLESILFTDNIYYYSWTPIVNVSNPTEASTYVHPEETTTYTVRVTDSFGCYKDDTVTVFVTERICDEPYVFIPNAFTPNGDGTNDILYVRSDILENFTFRVYNRLGELLFETSNVDKGWDGKYKGDKCIPGVYDFYLEGRCNNKEYILKKGNVTLIR
jgi:gliding motility-associated-like protein